MISAYAPAKINLFLHVGPRRADGLHVLESMVAFASAEAADRLDIAPADRLELRLRGPNAARLSPSDNLVLRAARALCPSSTARITLTKELPLAAGLGGGSADAAAALILLNRLWQRHLSRHELMRLGMELGADVPACLHGGPLVMRGAGEQIASLALPEMDAILVETGNPVPTAAVFAAFDTAAGPARPAFGSMIPRLSAGGGLEVAGVAGAAGAVRALKAAANDLSDAAISLCPPIAEALAALRSQKKVVLARMSGSGGACFGLCPTPGDARAAAARISAAHPEWWVRACSLGAGAGAGSAPPD